MAEPILPPSTVFLTAMIDAIVALRPEALQHFNSGGTWNNIPTILRPQAVMLQTRLADEIKQARLGFASGAGLRALCSSEFSTALPGQAQTALGSAVLTRTGVIGSGSKASIHYVGTINIISGLQGITATNVGTDITISGAAQQGVNGIFPVFGIFPPLGTAVVVGSPFFGAGTASITAQSGFGFITGMQGLSSAFIGYQIVVSGAANPYNNGTFTIVSVQGTSGVTVLSSYTSNVAAPDPNVISVVITAQPADPNNGAISWSLPTFPSGIIRAGTLFTKTANPSAQPLPITAAQYVVDKTVFVPQGATTATVLLDASAAGSGSNVPSFANYPTAASLVNPSSPLFDPTFTVARQAFLSGGSDGLPDPVLVEAAKAFSLGQYGPNAAAILAGLFRQQSVRHVAAFPAGALPYSQAFCADQSWACSQEWSNQIQQLFNNAFLGFGCAVRFGLVTNLQNLGRDHGGARRHQRPDGHVRYRRHRAGDGRELLQRPGGLVPVAASVAAKCHQRLRPQDPAVHGRHGHGCRHGAGGAGDGQQLQQRVGRDRDPLLPDRPAIPANIHGPTLSGEECQAPGTT